VKVHYRDPKFRGLTKCGLHSDPAVAASRGRWLAVMRLPESRYHCGEFENVNDPDCRCCMGHANHALGVSRTVVFVAGVRHRVVYAGQSSVLADDVARSLDVTPRGTLAEAVHVNGKRYKCLTDLNDNARLHPKQMAHFIETEMRAGNFVPFGADDTDFGAGALE